MKNAVTSAPGLHNRKARGHGTNRDQGNFAVYIHVPFCVRKCPYCSFYSVAGQADGQKRYAAAVAAQIRSLDQLPGSGQQLTSIFFGGGTPSILEPDLLAAILADCLHIFSSPASPAQQDALEISIEVNPATIDGSGLRQLHQAGFNRLSIGVQSFNDPELQVLGRIHSAREAVQTFELARRAGFENINLDLMYGLPGQQLADWQENLRQSLLLQPEHLSIYELTLEENTPFARLQDQGRLALPDEDTVLQMLAATNAQLSAAGLDRYEISNYAGKGFQCRHNINYWQNGSYIGLGPGAVSCLEGMRCATVEDLNRFCSFFESFCPKQGREERATQANRPGTAQYRDTRLQEIHREEETLNREAAFRETVIMGLRMTCGVSLQELETRFSIEPVSYYGTTLSQLVDRQLLVIEQGRLRLTERGLLLANTVMAQLV